MPGRNRERERERGGGGGGGGGGGAVLCVSHRRPAHDWPEEAEAGSVATSQPIDQ